MEFVVSLGSKNAIAEVLFGAFWQRWNYEHFLRNALDSVPGKVDADCREQNEALRHACRLTKPGPPRRWATPSPPPSPPALRLRQASDGGSEVMASPDPTINLLNLTLTTTAPRCKEKSSPNFSEPGATLSEIGQLLRHESHDETRI